MNKMAVLYHIARADFLERIRRPSFFVVLVLSLYVGYLFVPEADAGYLTVGIGDMRGIYNSAWIGITYSLMCSTFLSVIGFYLIKNSVARDRDTRVAQLLASTRLTGFEYLLGKTLSNFSLLGAVVATLMVTAIATQLIRAEDTTIHLGQIVTPTLVMALPLLLVISALAVLFEVTPLLRGALGNVAYFFLWNLMLVLSLVTNETEGHAMRGANDLPGLTRIFEQLCRKVAEETGQTFERASVGIQLIADAERPTTFLWNGMQWTPGMVFERLIWVAFAVGIVLIAVPIFRRFESLSIAPTVDKKKQNGDAEGIVAIPSSSENRTLTPIRERLHVGLVPMLRVELWLALRGANRWWYLGMGVLVLVCLVTPLEVARKFIFPIAWIWPMAIWSSMGTREKKHAVEQVMFTNPHFLKCQFPAMWLSGLLVTAVAGSGMAIRFLIAGEMNSLFAWGVGLFFIPTFALAAGVWTGRALLFEAIYVALWYIGPMNQVPFLDFMGATSSVTPAISIAFAIVTGIMLSAAWIGRRQQMSL
ncbi:MAG: hypothetical protein IPH75_14340 [bacterium]|nr:hypothetical protein [bacterium]